MNRVLFVNMNFYQYDIRIENEIRKQGNSVDSFCYVAPNTLISRIVRKLNSSSFQRCNNNYLDKFLSRTAKNKYDIVFVIVGRYLTANFLHELKEKNPSAQFILYLWDDIGRVENFAECSKHYDKIITFDPVDAINHGYKLLPLFYTEDFAANSKKSDSIFFSGFCHSDRIAVLEKILPHLNDFEKDFHLFTTRWQSIKNDFGIFRQYLRFSPMDLSENCRRMEKCRVVLDIQHPTQKGLTMRTIESIGAKTKLITTNKSVKEYDFYTPSNILVIDRENPVIPTDFLYGEYEELSPEISNKYKLESWVKNIFTEV